MRGHVVWEELDGLERADCWGVGRFVCWNEKFEKEASGLKPALASEKGSVGESQCFGMGRGGGIVIRNVCGVGLEMAVMRDVGERSGVGGGPVSKGTGTG